MKQELKLSAILLVVGVVAVFASGCVDSENVEEDTKKVTDTEIDEYEPEINPDDFVEVIDNPYFPLEVGTTYIYEGESDGEPVRIESFVTEQTKEIFGVTTTAVSVKEYEDGELVEDTLDWYAQDNDGNVWYFGEDSKEIEEGKAVSTAGSWEAGIDGAKPGIIMLANPQVGDTYRQEFYEDEAEDMGEVISLNGSVSVEYGSFENCLIIKEWTPLEPGIEENDYYYEGVGPVLEEVVKGGDERIELVEIIKK